MAIPWDKITKEARKLIQGQKVKNVIVETGCLAIELENGALISCWAGNRWGIIGSDDVKLQDSDMKQVELMDFSSEDDKG